MSTNLSKIRRDKMLNTISKIKEEETESKQALEHEYKSSPIRIISNPLKNIHKKSRPKNKA